MENNKKLKIAFYDTRPYDKEYFELANKNFGFEISFFDFHLNADTAITAANHQIVCAFVNDKIDKTVIDILQKEGVQLIAMRCAGYNNVDLKYIFNKIHVVRVPAYSPYSVAEHATALLLALTRKIPQAYNRTKSGNFVISGLTGRDLNGLTAGVFGTGKIGKIMAKILAGFGMKIVVADTYPDNEWAKANDFTYVSVDELFMQSDVLSLHCPLTPETKHIVNSINLSLMKKDAVIINTGRGALIDTSALVNALKHKTIGGAALDVYEEEDSYFFEDWSNEIIEDDVLARLLTFPNVLITGHQAFLTTNALMSIAETTLNNIKDYFNKQLLKNEICYQCASMDKKLECKKIKTGSCF